MKKKKYDNKIQPYMKSTIMDSEKGLKVQMLRYPRFPLGQDPYDKV